MATSGKLLDDNKGGFLRINSKNLIVIILFLSAFLGCIVPIYAQQNQRMLVRIFPSQKRDLEKLSDLDLDYTSHGLKDHVDVIIDQSQLNEIGSRGFRYELLQPINKANLYDPEYHTYEEVAHELDSLSQAYPEITELYQIGVSQQYGFPIWTIKISDNAAIDEDEFTVQYDGLHHAREPITIEVCMVLINHLLSNYGTDSLVTEIVDSIEIWITPILNPEGYKYLVDDDLSSPWWRKNMRDNDEDGQFDQYIDGVDLNRNYDYYFTYGGSTDFSSWVYRGLYPFSESEVAARRDLVLQQRFLCSVSYHSYYEGVYYMRGLEHNTLPETPLLDAFADSIASRIPKLSGDGYYEYGGFTHNANQSFPWMFAVPGVYEVLIETGTEFVPPGSVALRVAQDNLPGAMYLLEKTISGPGIKGNVTDAVTGEPIKAEVKILQYYRSCMTPRKSEAGYGRFHRFAALGNYTLQVSAPGYKGKTVEDVIVNQTGWTDVEIPLEWGTFLVVDTFYVDDDSSGASLGNGDGVVNTHETIELQIGLKNIGQTRVDSITATLVPLHYYAIVFQDLQEFGAIPVDSTVNSQGKFVFKVDYDCHDGFELPFKLYITGANGPNNYYDEFTIPVGVHVGITPIVDQQIPEKYHLFQNYPNPFNSNTTIRYKLFSNGKVAIKIYNLLGKEVCVLVSEEQPKGYKVVIWDGKGFSGKDVSSGIYFIYFEVLSKEKEVLHQQVRKIMMLR